MHTELAVDKKKVKKNQPVTETRVLENPTFPKAVFDELALFLPSDNFLPHPVWSTVINGRSSTTQRTFVVGNRDLRPLSSLTLSQPGILCSKNQGGGTLGAH